MHHMQTIFQAVGVLSVISAPDLICETQGERD